MVTGAARNIGRAVAIALAQGGAAVVVNAKASREEAEETATIIRQAGGQAQVHLADVSEPEQVRALVDATVSAFGRLDVLVNNAAFRAETPVERISLAEWRAVLASVLDASFLCAQACLPHLAGGTIVNIGGLTAHTGAAGRAHVVAAKAGLIGLTRALAVELAPRDITVNCVVPGTIETERNRPGAPERPAHRRALPPLGRRGTPDEVASAVRFLCGPGARYITGQTLHVSGGGFMA
ncbi:MAG: SDR family NAD(P)-dependent oxidoreductase [Clostridia bacterium]